MPLSPPRSIPAIAASEPKLLVIPPPFDISGANTAVEVYSLGILNAMIRLNTPPMKQAFSNSFHLLSRSMMMPIKSSEFPFFSMPFYFVFNRLTRASTTVAREAAVEPRLRISAVFMPSRSGFSGTTISQPGCTRRLPQLLAFVVVPFI